MSFKINPFTSQFDETGSTGGGGGGVSSFNGRTGAVTPQSGDYSADQISYDNTSSGLSSTDVQGAIDELAAESTTPGGPDKSIQFNNAGVFDGNSNLNWDNSNTNLNVGLSSTITPVGINVSKSRNGLGGIFSTNTNVGTAAMAGYSASTAAGFSIFTHTGTNYTTFGNMTLIANVTGNGMVFGVPTSKPIGFYQNSVLKAGVPSGGGFFVGGVSNLSPSDTNGFLYVPAVTGQPVGTPSSITGSTPIVVDTTNNSFYFYSSGDSKWHGNKGNIPAVTSTLNANILVQTVVTEFTIPLNSSAAFGAKIEYSMLSNNKVRVGTVYIAYNVGSSIAVRNDTYLETSALSVTLDVDISGGNLRLLYTNTDAVNSVALTGLITLIN